MKSRSLFLALAAAAAFAQVRDPLPVPEVAGYRTLKCDFHMHTVFSDGVVWPDVRLEEAWREGLDAIAITDHIDYTPHDADVVPNASKPYALARELAGKIGLILIPGGEIMAGNDIHFNMLFVEDVNALKGLSVPEALKRSREQGGINIWNHPGWRHKPEWFPIVDELYQSGLLDGMEIFNDHSFYPEAYPWIAEKPLTAMSGSDMHGLASVDFPNHSRPITLVFAKTADAAGIHEALKARRTAVWADGQVWGEEEYVRGLWSGAVVFEPAELSGAAGASAGLRLQNNSAIPFQVKVTGAPDWLRCDGTTVEPGRVTGMTLGIAKNAPRGTQRVELKLEVTNLHTGPGASLAVAVPVSVKIE